MKNILFIIFISVFVFKSPIYSQNKTMDSLNLALKNAKHDTIRLNIIMELCELCEIKDNLKYGLLASSIADRLISKSKSNREKEYYIQKKSIAYNIISVYYEVVLDKKDSIEFYKQKSVDLAKISNNLELINDQINGLAEMYRRENLYTKAMKIYTDGLKTAELNQDKKATIFNLKGISDTYSRMHNNQKALDYELKVLKISEEIGEIEEIPWIYLNLGSKYSNLKNYKLAISYFLKSYNIITRTKNAQGNLRPIFEIARAYNNLKNYAEARNYFFKALKITNEAYRGDSIVKGVINSEIGEIYFNEKNYTKALEYKLHGISLINSKSDGDAFLPYLTIGQVYLALKKYDLAEKNVLFAKRIAEDRKDLHNLKAVAKTLHDIFKAKGNNSKANEYLVQFYQLKDSLDKVGNAEELLYKELNYENEKNELKLKAEQDIKDKSAKEEKQKQQLIIFTVALILLIVLIFSALLFKRFRLTNKQKGIIEQQKHLVEEKHKEITDSINYAERIQRTFLATDELLNKHLHNYFILFKPKDVVSGDFYWADTLPNCNFVLATADSTGHGVPGAIMSLLNITSLEKAVEHLTNPSEILNHTRQTIISRLKRDGSAEGGKDGMDCSVIVFDFKNKQLHIAAAHNPVWIIRKRHCEGDSLKQSQTIDEIASLPRNDESLELIEIKPDKMPVGKHDRDQESFTSHSIQINEGDIIYTLTDGFPDQFGGEKGKKFMSKNLKELLLANAHLPMQQQKELLNNTFNNWVGDLEQVDDVTLIGIKI